MSLIVTNLSYVLHISALTNGDIFLEEKYNKAWIDSGDDLWLWWCKIWFYIVFRWLWGSRSHWIFYTSPKACNKPKFLYRFKIFSQISPTSCKIMLNIFISLLYMFRASMCPSSGENYCIYATLVFVNLYGWRLVCWLDWIHPTNRPEATNT